MRKFLIAIWHTPRNIFITMIRIYQATLSPDHGPLNALYNHGYCRHEPTCSEYGKQIINQRGVIIGGLMTAKRILTCTPWNKLSEEKILKTIERSSQELDS